jgi:hypothetical protein
VEHRWSPGGGLPEDGSTEGVLALGLGPRQLVRAWLALLLEIKVVVVRYGQHRGKMRQEASRCQD